eukprot:TRINITY_DN16195_c0_g1_i1.p1 TRINITY_DN16195_c0_g1~~TRINITY_DN16195_c0_g1_i1.p1  ORF type:complete len:603 (-),score=155.47 TRINITY_DN16195_c0_g1_i1:741-2402(-)
MGGELDKASSDAVEAESIHEKFPEDRYQHAKLVFQEHDLKFAPLDEVMDNFFPCLDPYEWRTAFDMDSEISHGLGIFKLSSTPPGRLMRLTADVLYLIRNEEDGVLEQRVLSYSTQMIYDKWIHEHDYVVKGFIPLGTTLVQLNVLSCTAHPAAMEHSRAESELPHSSVEMHFVPVQDKKVASHHCRIISNPIIFGGRVKNMFTVQWESSCASEDHGLFISMDGNGFRKVKTTHSILISPSNAVHRSSFEMPSGHTLEYYVATGSQKSTTYKLSSKGQADSYRVGLVSDTQSGAPVFRHHLHHLAQQGLSLIAHVGDVVQTNTNLKEWKTYWMGPWSEKSVGQQIPIVVARGNHDGNHPYAYSYIGNPSPTSSWFAFSVFDSRGSPETATRFVVLDSNWESADEVGIRMKQTKWLEHELSSLEFQTAGCKIVLIHVGPFIEYWELDVYSHENSMWGDFIREHWVPLFEKYKVDLVVSGHSHVYQRGSRNGVAYLILGGGGGKLDRERAVNLGMFHKTVIEHHYGVFEMNNGDFQLTVYGDRDEVIDSFQIKPI